MRSWAAGLSDGACRAAACAGRDPAAPVERRAIGRDGHSPSLAPTQKRKVSLQAVSSQSQPQAVSKLREGSLPAWAETAERGFGPHKRIEPGAGAARAMMEIALMLISTIRTKVIRRR